MLINASKLFHTRLEFKKTKKKILADRPTKLYLNIDMKQRIKQLKNSDLQAASAQ